MIELFVWLIEPRWCIINFVLNKYVWACWGFLLVNYKLRKFLAISCEFHAISRKNALLWIPRFRVQGLTVLYPILCYNGLLYNEAWLYVNEEIYHSYFRCKSILSYFLLQLDQSISMMMMMMMMMMVMVRLNDDASPLLSKFVYFIPYI